MLGRGFIPPNSGQEWSSILPPSAHYVGILTARACQAETQMAKPLTKVPPVPKDEFDRLLGRLMSTPPQPAKTIKMEGKTGKIVPATPPRSTPEKA